MVTLTFDDGSVVRLTLREGLKFLATLRREGWVAR